jgi:endogenous inhibitor of DNA gyrase (YacG/DUF329 family)
MPVEPASAGFGKSGKPAKCPICGRPSEDTYRPFCSRRCADVDLSRWLSGAYAIPDKGESEDGGEGSDPAGLPSGEDVAKGGGR